jgi:ABC-2 type transport system ATP-binding protein
MELKVTGLTKAYKKKVAVDDLSFTLSGGVYGLLGPNGSGKTTLMRMITGILEPTAGRVAFNGEEITAMGESYRNMLGYLPQEFGFYRGFTGYDTLRYIAALKGLDKRQTEKKVEELVETVGLAADAKRRVSGYSGGMRRRLGIAQALLNDPDILILDEPTSGLDPQERVRFRNMISEISSSRLVLLSTHIVSDVEYIAGQVMLMKEGRIFMMDAPGKILSSAKGRVWAALARPEDMSELKRRYLIGNIRNTEGGVELRIVSDEKPEIQGAAPVEPALEDVYLYHFRQASGE